MHDLLKKVEAFVTNEFKKSVWNGFDYHNVHHTQLVVTESKLLGVTSLLTDDQVSVLQIAAWFHDLGYLQGVHGHEKVGCDIAEKFLTKHFCTKQVIEEVKSLIHATNPSFQNFQTISEKIIRDADLSNAGLQGFINWNGKLRSEWASKQSRLFTDQEWDETQLTYLSSLNFLSLEGQKRYETQKKEYLEYYTDKASKPKSIPRSKGELLLLGLFLFFLFFFLWFFFL